MDKKILELFYVNVNSIEMTVRMANFLRGNLVFTLGDLVQHQEKDVLKWTYTPEDSTRKVAFSKKDLSELSSILKERGLRLGMAADAEILAKVDGEIKKLEDECDHFQKQVRELKQRLNQIRTKNNPPPPADPKTVNLLRTLFKTPGPGGEKTSAPTPTSTPAPAGKNCIPELKSIIAYSKERIADLQQKINQEESGQQNEK